MSLAHQIHLPTPDPDHPYKGGGYFRFPDIEGINLEGDCISLPPIDPSNFNILLVIFCPEALYGMKEWVPYCEELRKQYFHTPTQIHYLTTLILQDPPMEGDRTAFMQALFDIPVPELRRKSVLCYGDQSFIRSHLSLSRKSAGAIFLTDGNGNIIWKEDGGFTDINAEHLRIILETMTATVPRTRRS